MTTDLLYGLGRDFGRWSQGVALRWIALFLFLAFLALLAIGVAVLWRRGSGTAYGVGPGSDEAMAALRLRYAKGEVTRDEFLLASQDLGSTEPPPEPPAET